MGTTLDKRNWQFTPKKYVSNNKYGQDRTPTNNKYERNFTPKRYETKGRETVQQNNRQSEQQQQYQHRTQQRNTQSIFLDKNKQPQKYQQGVGNRFQQGVNNQHQQERTQNGTKFQQQNRNR